MIIRRRIILTESYSRNDKYMHNLYQNFMTILRYLSKSVLFIIVTINLKWTKMLNALSLD